MTNIVLCFDLGRPDNATAAHRLLDVDQPQRQTVWRSSGSSPTRHGPAAEAYRMLVETYEKGDQIFVFGAGRGAYHARALTRLLGAVGLLQADDDLFDYALEHWLLPRVRRSAADWCRLRELAGQLAGAAAAPVSFLGVWDTVKPAGRPGLDDDPLPGVLAGRHAVAIDGHRSELLTSHRHLDEVWFRGTHLDVAGLADGRAPLAHLALDWVLDGARHAGALIRSDNASTCATLDDATTSVRRPRLARQVLPDEALVHASVEAHLRTDPAYWRRLPHHVIWADADWQTRDERLVSEPTPRVRVGDAALAAAS